MTSIQHELKQTRPFASKGEEAGVALMRTADLLRRHVAVVLAPFDITEQQYNVLRILRGAGEKGLPTLDIAERMIEETPGITRLIDRLEAKKLVTRERCNVDRRRVYCRITKSGFELVFALDQPVQEVADAALSGLKKRHLAELLSLLDRAREAMHTSLINLRAANASRR
ncbi:MAG TPA: MarR family transcriptional regulator [Thermoanaerobaculia bacterium]|nr:MarR family transcriptional regulator [Thermoanaerobaculia bacterium]